MKTIVRLLQATALGVASYSAAYGCSSGWLGEQWARVTRAASPIRIAVERAPAAFAGESFPTAAAAPEAGKRHAAAPPKQVAVRRRPARRKTASRRAAKPAGVKRAAKKPSKRLQVAKRPALKGATAKQAAAKQVAVRAAAKKAARASARRTSPVGYRKVVAAGVPLHVVQIDLSRPEVHLAVATGRNGIGFQDSWPGMLERVRPVAALTGTYFCTSTAVPVGSIVVDGNQVHAGYIGTALTITPGKGARIVTCLPNRRYDWSGERTVLRAGPRLLTNGERTLFPRAEGFRDPAVYARKRRAAVATTRSGKLLLVATERPVLMRSLAEALRKIGAVDAMCMDGGSSTGLYYRGRTRVEPDRRLTNLLVVYDSPARYRSIAGALVPSGARIVQAEVGKRGG